MPFRSPRVLSILALNRNITDQDGIRVQHSGQEHSSRPSLPDGEAEAFSGGVFSRGCGECLAFAQASELDFLVKARTNAQQATSAATLPLLSLQSGELSLEVNLFSGQTFSSSPCVHSA